MPDILDNTNAFDLNVQTEDIAYKSEELIACKGCGRANPPNRFNCIYCAHELEVPTNSGAAIKFAGRKLEAWENGFNVVLVKQIGIEPDLKRGANLLGFEADALSEIVVSETLLPVARVETEKEANYIRENLEQAGFVCSIISDDALVPDKPHLRLAGMDFDSESLTLVSFNTGEKLKIAWHDLILIVSGILTKGRVDSLEKKRRRGKTKLINEVATSSDEQIFDIYTRDNMVGYRVHQAGFNFSCLGDDKGLLANENMRLLIGELKTRAHNAKYIGNYDDIRHLLNDVWEIESRKDFHGLQRSGFGKVESASVGTTSNFLQFNKFSRLQCHLQ